MGTAACPVCDAPLKRREWHPHVTACTAILHATAQASYRAQQAAAARRSVFGRQRAVAVESADGEIAFESG